MYFESDESVLTGPVRVSHFLTVELFENMREPFRFLNARRIVALLGRTTEKRLLGVFLTVLPLGIEPKFTVPQTIVLSIERREPLDNIPQNGLKTKILQSFLKNRFLNSVLR